MPFWKDLTATRQLLSDAAPLAVNKITTNQDIARIHNDAQVWMKPYPGQGDLGR